MLQLVDLNAKANIVLAEVNYIISQRKFEQLDYLLEFARHKSVAVRRKIAKDVFLLCQISDYSKVEKWKVSESDRQTLILLEVALERIAKKNSEVENVAVYSVSEAVLYIKNLVSGKEFIIEGELSDIHPAYSMYYFALKDKDGEKIDAQAFGGIVENCGFPLNEGWRVRVEGKFKIDKLGKLKLEVKKIYLTGEGELLQNLIILKAKLQSEGLFERKRNLAPIPRKILLIASQTSAGFGDFVTVLGKNIGGIKIYFLHSKMQGIGVEKELLDKLEMANKIILQENIETVVLTRGGGSKEDMQIFNNERVVRAIFGLKAPTIVAIGHERDESLAELVADCRASTPTDAANKTSKTRLEILQETNSDFILKLTRERLIYYKENSARFFDQTLSIYNQEVREIKDFLSTFGQFGNKILRLQKDEIVDIWQEIKNNLQDQIYQNKFILKFDYLQKMQLDIDFTRQNVDFKYTQILAFGKNQILNRQQEVVYLWQNMETQNPVNILKKGYVIVSQNNKTISKKSELKTNSKVSLGFVDGEIIAQII